MARKVKVMDIVKALARTRENEDEAAWLGASAIACEAADEYVRAETGATVGWWTDMPGQLRAALDRLEAVTRASAMRKVRP